MPEEYDIKQTLKDDGERLTECYIYTKADVVSVSLTLVFVELTTGN